MSDPRDQRIDGDSSSVSPAEGATSVSETLRRSEERFRRIFEYSNDAIFLIDPDQDRIFNVNERACRMLGYSREELLALPISAVHPTEMPKLMAFASAVFEQGLQRFGGEFR